VACAGAIISGASIVRSLVSSDVYIDEKTIVEDSILLPASHIGKNCKLNKVIVGEGCVIPDGSVIGYDREEDQKHYTVSETGIVLVTSEML
jgi:glucose-1-phosphate adenylyltransferase